MIKNFVKNLWKKNPTKKSLKIESFLAAQTLSKKLKYP
jgi:hypothetical protein